MVKDKTLHDLFYDTLKDIYFARESSQRFAKNGQSRPAT